MGYGCELARCYGGLGRESPKHNNKHAAAGASTQYRLNPTASHPLNTTVLILFGTTKQQYCAPSSIATRQHSHGPRVGHVLGPPPGEFFSLAASHLVATSRRTF